MLKHRIVIFVLILTALLCTSCASLTPTAIRYKAVHLWEELFSEATVTMPVLVTSTYTLTPTKIPTATMTPTITLTPTKTTVPWSNFVLPTFEILETQSLPLSARDSINQVKDITIPDDTILQPNQIFIKSWRMTNSGSNTWEDGTKLMMDTTFNTELPTVVKAIFLKENDWIDFTPGGWGSRVYNVAASTQVDLALLLRAPSQPGSYQIQFRLVNTDGEIINTPFWMRFFVAGPTATPSPEPVKGTPTPTQEPYDWSGHWIVREPFIAEEVRPVHAWLYQNGEELTGFLYDTEGNPVIIKGALFDGGRTFNGEIYYPWQKQTTAVVWRMQMSRDQFYAVTPLGVMDESAVCGGRNGANLPDSCALPAGA